MSDNTAIFIRKKENEFEIARLPIHLVDDDFAWEPSRVTESSERDALNSAAIMYAGAKLRGRVPEYGIVVLYVPAVLDSNNYITLDQY